jgi:hypothetical protein
MIIDPWQQLARRLVPQGLLGAGELDIHFTPTMPQVSSCTIDSLSTDDARTDDNIEALRSALLDRV